MNLSEHLSPILTPPPGGPIPNIHATADLSPLFADQGLAVSWAVANHLNILSVGADRNGVFLTVVPNGKLSTLFGDECAQIKRVVESGLRTELWLGTIDTGHSHIRVFWREVTCVH